jgi:cytochrome c oxidase subunit 2
MRYILFSKYFIFMDFPEVKQFLFQDPATPAMYFIIGAHNTIMFYLFIITGLVIVLMFYIVLASQEILLQICKETFVLFNKKIFYSFQEITLVSIDNRKFFYLYQWLEKPLVCQGFFTKNMYLKFFRNNLSGIVSFSFLENLKGYFEFLIIYFSFKHKSVYISEISTRRLVVLNFISNKLQRWNEQHLLETFWTEYPSFLVALLVIPVLIFSFASEEVETTQWNFVIKVIGNQWFWNYELIAINGNYDWLTFYNSELKAVSPKLFTFESRLIPAADLLPGQFRLSEVDNCLVLPINTSIHILVTSSDVIHSWSVPSLGIKIDAVPGRLNTTSFTLTRPGIFYGQCSELCGVNHFAMPIKIIGVLHEYVVPSLRNAIYV